ncbi:hypothetical protein HUA76_22600 [Myxococcus sp. CA056]|uniref:hypothetical protein n=1 Tax=Myxococcus sp. CA056 TaxID=2741740 RepID=UPI00157AA2E8|nr:hypothetical protein [Myxococcus sp. CA056]NTX13602.1 hypothetical protein [Myxococcus sp. CA056]
MRRWSLALILSLSAPALALAQAPETPEPAAAPPAEEPAPQAPASSAPVKAEPPPAPTPKPVEAAPTPAQPATETTPPPAPKPAVEKAPTPKPAAETTPPAPRPTAEKAPAPPPAPKPATAATPPPAQPMAPPTTAALPPQAQPKADLALPPPVPDEGPVSATEVKMRDIQTSARFLFQCLLTGDVRSTANELFYPFQLEEKRFGTPEELVAAWVKQLRLKRTDLVTLFDVEVMTLEAMEKKYGKAPARLGLDLRNMKDIWVAVGNLSGRAGVFVYKPYGDEHRAFAYTD